MIRPQHSLKENPYSSPPFITINSPHHQPPSSSLTSQKQPVITLSWNPFIILLLHSPHSHPFHYLLHKNPTRAPLLSFIAITTLPRSSIKEPSHQKTILCPSSSTQPIFPLRKNPSATTNLSRTIQLPKRTLTGITSPHYNMKSNHNSAKSYPKIPRTHSQTITKTHSDPKQKPLYIHITPYFIVQEHSFVEEESSTRSPNQPSLTPLLACHH